MAVVKAFKGIRPAKELAPKVAELPYDVVDSDEARKIAEGNPYSFFHVSKAEIDMPVGTDIYAPAVYQKGKENFKLFMKNGTLVQDGEPSLYLYTQVMNGKSQTGLVACVSIDDYISGVIKKHELTREDKENDRTAHLNIVGANTGPVFLFFKDDAAKQNLFGQGMAAQPEYDFTAGDGIRHIFRVVSDPKLVAAFETAFAKDVLYIADGHHRAASAARVGSQRRIANPAYTGGEEFNFFLAVIFPAGELSILAYNRLVRDLNGLNADEFIAKIKSNFTVTQGAPEPPAKGSVSMYLNKTWYKLVPSFALPADPVEQLDVKLLQDKILQPILGIQDPRKDERIQFVGGIRGTEELTRLVDSGEFAAAFSMFPTSIKELIDVADANLIMPPKSTWFEPKLRSGLVVHSIEE